MWCGVGDLCLGMEGCDEVVVGEFGVGGFDVDIVGCGEMVVGGCWCWF